MGLLVSLQFPSVGLSYEEVEVKTGGRISGFVRYEGKAGKAGYLELTKNKEVCGKVADESLVVGVGRGVRYAAVTLEGIGKGKAAEREGEYQLTEVPAGKYRLEIWHPDFGAKAVPFGLVRDGEVLALDAEMKTQR